MPINWIKAIDLGYGQPGDNQAAYDRQPGDVRIYNPENLPLADILVAEDQGRGYGLWLLIKFRPAAW